MMNPSSFCVALLGLSQGFSRNFVNSSLLFGHLTLFANQSLVKLSQSRTKQKSQLQVKSDAILVDSKKKVVSEADSCSHCRNTIEMFFASPHLLLPKNMESPINALTRNLQR